MEESLRVNWDKFYRKDPIKEFDINQTMYSLVKNESMGYENLYATCFMGNNKTYEDLELTADCLASAVSEEGIKEGDSVAILTISMPIVQESMLALSKLGVRMVFIDLRTRGKDLINNINDAKCKMLIVFEDVLPVIEGIIDETDIKKVIVCSPKDYLSSIQRILLSLKNRKEGKVIKLKDDERFVWYKDFLDRDYKYDVIAVPFDKDRESLIVGSSGSTGKSKQIIHTEYNFNSAIQKMAYLDLPFYRGHTMHISIPPFIIYGLGNSIYASLAFTMKAYMTPYVAENTVYDDLGEFDISLAAPLHYRYMYNKIINLQKLAEELEKDSSEIAKKELKKIYRELTIAFEGIKRAEVFVSGGDKIGSDELLEMERFFEKPIVNGYGNNECLGAAVVSPRYANKPGSIGIPMKGTSIKIVCDEQDKALSSQNIGELYISGDNIFKGYLGNPIETNKIKVMEDGREWVKTGDLAYIDEDGYIIHKGRNRRLIIKEAFKISPDTIEEVIAPIPFVKECVVVGVEDQDLGSVPMAFIVLKDNSISFDDAREVIKNKCIEELPDYEVPTYFEQIDSIPYTPNEKQDFRALENIGNEILNKKVLVKK